MLHLSKRTEHIFYFDNINAFYFTRETVHNVYLCFVAWKSNGATEWSRMTYKQYYDSAKAAAKSFIKV